jgi:hypothetical protein
VFPGLRFTTAPMLLDSVLVVGDSDGRLRGLLPGARPQMLWRTAERGFAVTALAYGAVLPDDAPALVWGDAIGQVFLARGTQRGGYAVAAGWPRRVNTGSDAVEWLLLIQGDDGETGQILACDAAGRVVLWDEREAAAGNWPLALGASPAGPPAVGDPDGDGLLEIALTSVDGQVHVLDFAGRAELGWPRSVWHPDVAPRGSLRTGPILVDIEDPADGRPEVLQGSVDGTVHIFDAAGEEVPGWPAQVGFATTAGPIVAPLEEDGGLQILTADAQGFVTILKTGWPQRAMLPGEMWSSHIDAGRQRCYPRSLRPEVGELSGLLDLSSLNFTPNPVVGEEGYLRVRMGRSGVLSVELFDTSGQDVWRRSFRPAVGWQGDRLALDLSGIDPGLYVAKITARAGSEELSVLRKLALVR